MEHLKEVMEITTDTYEIVNFEVVGSHYTKTLFMQRDGVYSLTDKEDPPDIFKGLSCTHIEDEFDLAHETPMCPNCHADLVKDDWSLNDDSYYCEDCGTWHSIEEVKQFS